MSRGHPLRVADFLQHILEAFGNVKDDLPLLKTKITALA